MMNPYLMPIFIPKFPHDNPKPPTIYALLNSIVNFNKEEQIKISDLAKNGRNKIFDFNYPLSSIINKEDFECMILNHYMMRRIGFDTLTAFKLQLNVKLNEIMPLYNKLFDALESWNIFNDGEIVERDVKDNRTIDNVNSTINKNNINSESDSTSDRRFSEMPQNQLDNITDGTYLTDYNLDKNTDKSKTTGDSTSNNTSNTKDDNTIKEIIKRSPADKINIYKQFLESKNNIYSMIFKDLDNLFYQLV